MGMCVPLSPSQERGRVLCLNQLTSVSLPVNFFVLWRRADRRVREGAHANPQTRKPKGLLLLALPRMPFP